MARLVAPDGAIIQSSVQGARLGTEVVYQRGRDGTTEVTNQQHIKALKSLGYREAYGANVTKGGFICTECGFQAFFKTCSRCGGTCQKGS